MILIANINRVRREVVRYSEVVFRQNLQIMVKSFLYSQVDLSPIFIKKLDVHID